MSPKITITPEAAAQIDQAALLRWLKSEGLEMVVTESGYVVRPEQKKVAA